MLRHIMNPRRPAVAVLTCMTLVLGLSACSSTTQDMASRAGGDPYEKQNRQIHEFNKKLDKAVLRPVGVTVSKVVPSEAATLVSNFGNNLSIPRDIVNNLLQARFGQALANTARFALNTTVGLGGFIDAAGAWGLPGRDTDFGETLYVWGVPEGAYMELPVLGPSTQRRTLGRLVDLALDPLEYVLPSPEKNYGTYARTESTIDKRGRDAGVVDSLLYDSVDSYTQLKLIYTQNRRYTLGDGGPSGAADEQDPYSSQDTTTGGSGAQAAGTSSSASSSADPYDAYGDPYDTSYSDPYDQ